MQFGYFPQPRHYAENLLINPRGVINQADETDGVLPANQYFRDGWKAGANGAEVYVESDGFRLVSGSIVQVIENTFEVGTRLRANLDVISGSPVFDLGGSGHLHTVADDTHITLEISGDKSKFTRAVVATGSELPIYAERALSDDLTRCMRYLIVDSSIVNASIGALDLKPWNYGVAWVPFKVQMQSVPAVSVVYISNGQSMSVYPYINGLNITYAVGLSNSVAGIKYFKADARL